MNRRGEAGVTLVELLVTVLLLGLIVPAIGAAFIVGFRTYAETGDRVVVSSATDIAAAYWAPDVMNATSVDLGASPGCAVPAGAAPVVSFQTSAGRITWFVSGSRLVRRECTGVADTTVTAALAASPSVTCQPTNCSRLVQLSLSQVGSTPALASSLAGTRRNTGA